MPSVSRALSCGLMLFGLIIAPALAHGADPESFQEVLAKQSRARFQAIADYVTAHPEAADAEDAYLWLFDNAVVLGLEAETIPIVEAYTKRPMTNEAIRNYGDQVRGLGFAKLGQVPEAMQILDAQLQGLRARGSSAAIDFALLLAIEVQMSGDREAVRSIYERIGGGFLVNPEVRAVAERKLARLDLVGQAPPALKGDDLDGKALDLGEYKGKVLLIDFWATNCAPCIEEMPNLKKLHAEYQAQGFEILGISLDFNERLPVAFKEQAELTWRMAMNETPDGGLGDAYSVPTIPATFLVDRQGKIAYFDLKGANLRKAVEKLLKADP